MKRRQLWMMWWAGLLAAITFAHLLRAAMGLQVVIGAHVVPVWVSWALFPAAGLVSLWLVRKARGIG